MCIGSVMPWCQSNMEILNLENHYHLLDNLSFPLGLYLSLGQVFHPMESTLRYWLQNTVVEIKTLNWWYQKLISTSLHHPPSCGYFYKSYVSGLCRFLKCLVFILYYSSYLLLVTLTPNLKDRKKMPWQQLNSASDTAHWFIINHICLIFLAKWPTMPNKNFYFKRT